MLSLECCALLDGLLKMDEVCLFGGADKGLHYEGTPPSRLLVGAANPILGPMQYAVLA